MLAKLLDAANEGVVLIVRALLALEGAGEANPWLLDLSELLTLAVLLAVLFFLLLNEFVLPGVEVDALLPFPFIGLF